MVEFIVAAMFFIVPLYLIIIALGKFADVQSSATQAARYAAWERTVWLGDADWRRRMGSTANAKTSEEVRSEIAQRIVGADRPTLASTDKSRSSLSNGEQKTWTDPEGKNLLAKYSDLTLTEGDQALTATQCLSCDVPTALPFPKPFDLGINVPNDHLVVAQVKLAIGADSASLKRLFPAYTDYAGLTMTDRVALLPNEWTANGSDGTLAVVKDAVPTANDPIKTTISASLKIPMGVFAMEIDRLKFGDIEPDQVPADRLR